jgi:hypothetical protein
LFDSIKRFRMNRFFLFALILSSAWPFLSAGQFTRTSHTDPLAAVRVMDDVNDPFAFTVQYAEAPQPGGDAYKTFLRGRKAEAVKATPLNPAGRPSVRGTLEKPEILASFSGNNVITGTPLDNHLAVGLEEHVVSTINVNMLVARNNGFWLGSYDLEEFFAPVGTSPRYFDPRVIYDPETDRFILVLINGFDCSDSQIVLAFSKTNNPRGAWNLYALDGCLDDDGTFADYPMISLTDGELFLTYNEVDADSTWQAGFMGTQIHQIDKMSGYDGLPLGRTVWRDIEYNGRLLRNICPIRNADVTLETTQYFLSTRNFDISNDTVFQLHLTGRFDNPNATLEIVPRLLGQPYGVPPNALQVRDSLQTNDARVLDAFKLGDEVQWVSNTMDFNTGRSGVYHGFLNLAAPETAGTGYIIGHATDYLGYPGIAWTGTNPSEKDAIIVVSHASTTRHPGGSAFYSNGLGEYSDLVTIIEGQKPVDMLTGPLERWGDYAGIQRLYHEPGAVWVACSYGRSAANVNEAWLAKLQRPEQSTATTDIGANPVDAVAFPNPAGDYVQVRVTGRQGGLIQAILLDANGRPLQTIKDMALRYGGEATITFSTHALTPGVYFVEMRLDGVPVATRSFIRE